VRVKCRPHWPLSALAALGQREKATGPWHTALPANPHAFPGDGGDRPDRPSPTLAAESGCLGMDRMGLCQFLDSGCV
jgi:hypothetical protein